MSLLQKPGYLQRYLSKINDGKGRKKIVYYENKIFKYILNNPNKFVLSWLLQ